MVAALGVLALAEAACELVGQGDLPVQNDLSGIGADNTVFYAWEHESGDVWPPTGMLSLAVRGDDFGSPPSYGMDGFLYVVRTDAACPMREGGPEVFELADVTIVGVVTVTGGTVNQVLSTPDTAGVRQDRWALIEIGEFSATEPGHAIHRCGTVTWS
ncbi:MAG: hypothetical protein WEB52_07740 [Dehalococcoidia bacterium]